MTDLQRQLWRSAAWYAHRGWRVFPCIPGRKEPAVKDWPHKATTDANQISRWWSREPYNIGLACGPDSGVYVIDVDRHGADGEASLAKVSRSRGQLPETVEQRTGSGGRQLLFVYPEGRDCPNTASKIGDGIDTRGAGGFVVLPPSIHPCGDAYRWIAGPHERDMAELPAKWLRLVERRREMRITVDITPLKTGQANVDRLVAWLERAQEKQRNSSLFWAAKRCVEACSCGMARRKESEAALLKAALRIGLPRIEAEKTIASAWRSG